MPRESGPRCSRAEHMRAIREESTDPSSPLTFPTIPHIRECCDKRTRSAHRRVSIVLPCGQTPTDGEAPPLLTGERRLPPVREQTDRTSNSAVTRSVRGAATVFSDVASVMGARVASMVLSLASVLLVTHLLSPSAYGGLPFFTMLSTLVFTITSGWTSTA